MSDFEDKAIEELHAHIDRTYLALAFVCALLPVPVDLPTNGNVEASEIIPAVARASELVMDMPLPEEQQALVVGACIFWLGAAELFMVIRGSGYRRYRSGAVFANLTSADESLREAGRWLIENYTETEE